MTKAGTAKAKTEAAAPKKDARTTWNEFRTRYLSRYYIQKAMHNVVTPLLRYIILICLGFIVIKPLWSLLKNAITAPEMLGDKSIMWIPQQISAIFLQMSMSESLMNYWQSLAYTLVVTLILTVLQVVSAGLAAYAFARLRFKGMNILFFFVILTIVVPSDSIMLAQYAAFRNFDIFGIIGAINGTGKGINLIGNPLSLYILAGTGMGIKSGLYIYFLRQAIRNLPISIEEAAFVDGAGFLRTFFTIVVPSMSGSILTVSVLSFLWNYTDTYYTSLLNPNTNHLAYNLSSLSGNIRWYITTAANTNQQWLTTVDPTNPFVQQAMISACSLLTVLPLLILYAFVQKRFVQGAARSGLGGD